MDLSPNGKPAEGNVWSTPTLAEQTIAGVYNHCMWIIAMLPMDGLIYGPVLWTTV